MQEIKERREATKVLKEKLISNLNDSKPLLVDKACVCVTGSFGREEVGARSDLDLFIAGKNSDKMRNGISESVLLRLDEICVKADLIETTRLLGIEEFDGDGRYLAHYSIHQLTKTLGTPEDDALNTFTARLLLLLESQPLIGEDIYRHVIDEVVAAYWGDYEDHKPDFVPAFLTNDILRLWRTFCVNYEARTERHPEAKKMKRKVKNYTLKYSRLLTCYSAILYLLALFNRYGTVSPADAVRMAKTSPTRRLEWLIEQEFTEGAHHLLKRLLTQYDAFLQVKRVSNDELAEKFKDKDVERKHFSEAKSFGETMYSVLNEIGGDSRLHRLLVV